MVMLREIPRMERAIWRWVGMFWEVKEEGVLSQSEWSWSCLSPPCLACLSERVCVRAKGERGRGGKGNEGEREGAGDVEML